MISVLKRSIVFAVCFFIAAIHLSSYAHAARFFSIPNFYISAISADGKVATGEWNHAPALWTEAGGVESLPLPAGNRLFNVTNLSGDGTTIVGGLRIGTGLSQRYEAFRWTRASGYQTLGRFSNDWLDYAYAHDVSYDGSVVVGTNDTPNGRRGFYWTEATGQINMGTLGSANPFYDPFSEGNAVSADGSVVVGYVTTSADEYYKAFRWTPSGGYNVIGLPPVTNGIPAGGAGYISGNGLVIAGQGQTGGDIGSWTWTSLTGFSPLPTGPGDTSAGVNGISFDGSVLVGTQIVWNQPAPNGVIYNAGLWRDTPSGYEFSLVADVLEAAGIDLTGWHLRGVSDVSADGRIIIGTGTDPLGVQRSWYAVLSVPEPMSLTSLGLGLAAMLVMPRRIFCGM